MRDLRSPLAFRQMTRPGNDCRQANAAFENAELGPAIRAASSPAEMRPFLDRVAVVRLVNDDRPLAQPGIIQIFCEIPDPLIQRSDKRRVKISWVRQVPIIL